MDFTSFLNALKDAIQQLVTKSVQDFRAAAVQDAQAFLSQTGADLEKWMGQVADGSLTPEEFEFLVKGKKDLAEMQALKQAGLALVRIDQFRNSLLDLVVGTALKMVPKP